MTEEEIIEREEYARAKADAMFTVWKSRHAENIATNYEVVSVEQLFTFPLTNPDTGANSKTFVEAGKMDVVLRRRRDRALVLMEHKTAADRVGPASPYWDRLRLDTQISKYQLAVLHKYPGENVGGAIYDVASKPAMRPAKVPTLDDDGVKIVLDKDGNRVRTKDGKKWRESADTANGYELQGRLETPDEYGARILGKLQEENTEYFAWREVPRLDSDLVGYMKDAWLQAKMIMHMRNNNLWPRNPSACTAYGQCEFLDLCCGRRTVDGINYAPAPAHIELGDQETGGLSRLTNSSLTALRKCPKFYELRYETPTQRVGVTFEALRFGTYWHGLLEEFFKSLQ